jgi:hypothetical protein
MTAAGQERERERERENEPVNPSFACVLIVLTARLKTFAGATWTSSRSRNPHSREVRNSIILAEACDRFEVFAIIE